MKINKKREKEEINRKIAVKMSTIAVIFNYSINYDSTYVKVYEKKEVPDKIWDFLIRSSSNIVIQQYLSTLNKEFVDFIENNGEEMRQINKPCDLIVMFEFV